MDEILTQDLKKQFDALPAEVQKALTEVDLSTKLQDIVKNDKLMIDQASALQIETILVHFGLEPLENYTNNLIKNVGLSNIQASVIAHDVNETIFKNVRESLKNINEAVLGEEKITEQESAPSKEDMITDIEQPENIKGKEESVSFSSLKSNNTIPNAETEIHPEMAAEGIEIKTNNLPEIAPEAMMPAVPFPAPKQTEPLHLNVSPVENIVESKLSDTVIVPKQTIVVEEKTKLPEKPISSSGDPYREPMI